ncbi:hypothetical protein Tco_1503820 [Tanacetum coccineum]
MSPPTIRGLEKEVEELSFRGFRKELWFRVGGGGGGTVLVCSCGGGGGFCDLLFDTVSIPGDNPRRHVARAKSICYRYTLDVHRLNYNDDSQRMINNVSVKLRAAIEEYQLFTQELEAFPGWVVNKDMSIEYLQELVQRDEEMVLRLQVLEKEVEERADEKILFIEKLKRNVSFE